MFKNMFKYVQSKNMFNLTAEVFHTTFQKIVSKIFHDEYVSTIIVSKTVSTTTKKNQNAQQCKKEKI